MRWSTSEALIDPAARQPMTFRSKLKFFLRHIPVERICLPLQSWGCEGPQARWQLGCS
jgi:hypothetical protein